MLEMMELKYMQAGGRTTDSETGDGKEMGRERLLEML